MSATIAGTAVVAEARLWLGTPYRHQAALRGVGCDCLGLVRGVWQGLYGDEPEAPPPYSGTWAESAPAGSEPLLEAAERHLVAVPGALAAYEAAPGDVLLFRFRTHLPARHCAVATGAGTMIHAHDRARVAEVALTPWWRRHLAGVFRFPQVPFPKIPFPKIPVSEGRDLSRVQARSSIPALVGEATLRAPP